MGQIPLPIKEIRLSRGVSYELHCANPRWTPGGDEPREIRRRYPTVDLALAAYVAVRFDGVIPHAALGDLGGPVMSFRELAEEFLDQCQVKPSSVRRYRGIVTNHLLPGFGHQGIDQVTQRDVARFVAEVRQGRGRYEGTRYAEGTLQLWYSLLAAIFAYAVTEEYLERSPVRGVRFETAPAAEPAWTLEEAKTFLTYLRDLDHPHYTYWYVALATGLRGGEQAALRWTDIRPHPDGGATLAVVENRSQDAKGRFIVGSPKTRASTRRLSLGPETVAILAYQRERIERVKARYPEHWREHDLVFPRLDHFRLAELGQMMTGKGLTTTLHRLAMKLGLPDITPHAFRHLHGSLVIYDLGLPDTVAQARLGHASIKVTKDVYAPAPDELQRRAAVGLDQLLAMRD